MVESSTLVADVFSICGTHCVVGTSGRSTAGKGSFDIKQMFVSVGAPLSSSPTESSSAMALLLYTAKSWGLSK
jgi:hypothetical protein